MQKTPLLIDFDGTICFDYFWRSADESIKGYIKEFLFSGKSPLVESWMKGDLTSEDVNAVISRNLGIDYDYLWKIFVSDCRSMYIRPSTTSLIKKAKKKFFTILITDNMDSFDRFTLPALGLEKYFHHIANSYNYMALKNQEKGKLFQLVASRNKVNLNEAILIDNSKVNCTMFSALGGQSYLVKTADDIESILIKLLSTVKHTFAGEAA